MLMVDCSSKRVGEQLCEGLGSLPMLTSLTLDFQWSKTSMGVWEKLAQIPAFPALEVLNVDNCHLWIKDFAK